MTKIERNITMLASDLLDTVEHSFACFIQVEVLSS